MPITTENTSFTHDILGRYVCNTFGEAKNSGTLDAVYSYTTAFRNIKVTVL
jgi:hypothetical protein